MVGPIVLRTKKSLVTRYTNNLKKIIEEAEAHQNTQAHGSTGSVKTDELIFDLNASATLASNALNDYTEALDTITDIPEEQLKETHDYVDSAVATIDSAQRMAIKLEKRRRGNQNEGTPVEPAPGPVAHLPAIPIPVFTGKIWEFTNFWTLFEANVHHQPLSKLMKFNYLIGALRGNARELIRRFPVTEANYDHAIQLLREKYGDNCALIDNLQSRLESLKADNTTVAAQRRLLENVLPLTTQLEDLGISLNGSYLTRKLLGKFSPALQQKVLSNLLPRNKRESDWHMKAVLAELDNVITMEEQIQSMVEKNPHGSSEHFKDVSYSNRIHNKELYNTDRTQTPSKMSTTNKKSSACIFCESAHHKPSECTKVANIEERRSIMQKQNRCLNCGREGHWIKECTSDGCRNCKGLKHHHTLCPKRNTHSVTQAIPVVKEGRNSATSRQERPQRTTPDTQTGRNMRIHETKSRGNAHSVQVEISMPEIRNRPADTPQETAQTNVTDSNGSKVLLLTGMAQIYDEIQGNWREVEILFDTGADQSFITTALAKELGLNCTQQQGFLMYTFGKEKPTSITCGTATLNIWDLQGEKHEVYLYTTPVLTGKKQKTQLTQEDLSFMSRHKIRLSKTAQNTISKPQILLGCDQLWSLLQSPLPRFTLPSGLQLIPSKLGYLLTGKQQARGRETPPGYDFGTSLISMINVVPDLENDINRWDRYWSMDSAGIYEFTGTKSAEKTAANIQVNTFFKNTIERRIDGYYVRFPYKDGHPRLPDNKSIALKRLEGVVNMLQTKPDLLKDYDTTFRTQLEKGIIEEIPNNHPKEGPIVHYIPHQPVITPHKETTKLRIVFDASSHYKNCPSLNDVLHQGPMILPELYSMLIRFRMLPYVATADVEKAFLQVRLHELDRDATRVLWLKNMELPIDEDNIVTYRFTRVTFGLNVSPFLLAGTIHHHLEHAVQDTNLAQEIRENLYVDNLILSAETQEDLIKKIISSRQIFADMNMNLRQFLASKMILQNAIPPEACAETKQQKVLGIKWNAADDSLHMECQFAFTDKVSKRTIARQIASIYDPLGWLVPLLTQAKHFQQTLWKHNLDWDTVLPETFKVSWDKIVQEVDGFQHTIPRRLLHTKSPYDLAIFADASEIAMATCAYLFTEELSTLVMAKCKLPSIKAPTTMPKLEMNALTMATRLAWSIYEAMKKQVTNTPQTPRRIFIFSDSQIALSWLSKSPTKSNPGVLVANRLAEIRRIVHTFQQERAIVHFAYVNTRENPADAGTRGLTREQLQKHCWWTGPKFLQKPMAEWNITFYEFDERQPEETEEEANVAAAIATGTRENPWINLERFSSFATAKRVTARALMFVKKLLRPLPQESCERIYGKIPELRVISDNTRMPQATDIRTARMMLIRHHQTIYITETIRKSVENSLRLFMDSDGLWRSKGRLGNSALDEPTKYPLFVAPNTDLARLIIQEAHGSYHQGIEHTISTVRQNYWILKLRHSVRKLIQRCVKCRRFNSLPYPYPCSVDLPHRRVLRSRPFQHIGLDFFDLPVDRQSNTRYYGCIFTCTVTRLIHIEVLLSMNTVDFINALRRFIARRGVPDSITCDNAPTFLLSSALLADSSTSNTLSAEIQDVIATREIEWKHITPYAPWQGGFYERLIKSVKHALNKALRGAAVRSGEHLHTILTEVEACLNSRPLTYQGSTLENFSSIRPIDFIQKDLNLTLSLDTDQQSPESDVEYLPLSEHRAFRTRKEVIEALKSSTDATEKFWKIWQEQYLTSLREKHKKMLTNQRHTRNPPAVGDVVLVCDPVLPRNEWRMARIISVKSGIDGAVREVELVTSTRRKIRRPVNLLIPLEVVSDTTPSVTPAQPEEHSEDPQEDKHGEGQEIREPRCNLRPRHTTPATKRTNTVSVREKTFPVSKWFLFYIALLTLSIPARGTSSNCRQKAYTPNSRFIFTTNKPRTAIREDVRGVLYRGYQKPLVETSLSVATRYDPLPGGQPSALKIWLARQNFNKQYDYGVCAITFKHEYSQLTTGPVIIILGYYRLSGASCTRPYVLLTSRPPQNIYMHLLKSVKARPFAAFVEPKESREASLLERFEHTRVPPHATTF